MKTLRLPLLGALTLLAHSSSILAQGPLTPPAGAPAPTMRTLEQIEPRTPIDSAPFNITASGSYYLTGNLTVSSGNAISITADDVTLDLRGFIISSTASPASGIGVSLPAGSRRNVAIRNGVIRGDTTFAGGVFTTGGFQHGVRVVSLGANVQLQDLTIQGVSLIGISLPTGVRTYSVDRCTVEVCGTAGIIASMVRNCSADTCGTDGIDADMVRDSFGGSVGTGSGNNGIQADTVINSIGVAAAGAGIAASTATNCEATSATGAAGLNVIGAASFCRAKRDGGVAINAGIAIACTVNGTGTVTSPSKQLGTP